MKNLCHAIIEAARFLELSSDDVVDPDAAVATLEVIGATIQSATQGEKEMFILTCRKEAARLRATGDLKDADFVGELPTAMGLAGEV